MSLLPDELKPQSIKCANCQQYISSNVKVCRFCSTKISDEYKQFALGSVDIRQLFPLATLFMAWLRFGQFTKGRFNVLYFYSFSLKKNKLLKPSEKDVKTP